MLQALSVLLTSHRNTGTTTQTLSDDEQREKIFTEYVVLDVEGQQVNPSTCLYKDVDLLISRRSSTTED
jgi:hypothetical protein